MRVSPVVADRLRDRVTGRGRWRVQWHSRWSRSVADALRQIPESAVCPHDLYEALLERRCSAQNPIAVVSSDAGPIAVVGLRGAGFRRWEILTNWMTPGFVCAAPTELVLPVVARLRREVVVAWWRMPTLDGFDDLHDVITTPVHRIEVGDTERYWRSTKHWQTVTAARRKCADLALSINAPGDSEWVVRSWEQKWRSAGSVDDRRAQEYADDRITIADHLARCGRQYTMVLRLDGRPVAGTTNIVHDGVLTAGVLYRDDSIGSMPTGVRIIDAAFELAAEIGCDQVDLGGGHEYKAKWAPIDGVHHQFTVAPAWHVAAKSGARRARSGVRRASNIRSAWREDPA